MNLDDEVCLCFHVSKRKVLAFLRVEQPSRPGQLSECYGAGTGCGWCRSYLTRLFEASKRTRPTSERPPSVETEKGALAEVDPATDEYAQARANYIRSGGGIPPPGATPLPDAES